MPLYCVYKHILETSLPLPIPTQRFDKSTKSDFIFKVLPSQKQTSPGKPWLFKWSHKGKRWLSYSIDEKRHLLRFHELADFEFGLDTPKITCKPIPETKIDTVVHLLLDQVIPRILSQRGSIVLHASAVATDNRVIAFIGSSGLGKSTLAACLVKQGLTLISDDSLVIDEIDDQLVGTPSYPGMRLWDDVVDTLFHDQKLSLSSVAEYTSKNRVNLDQNKAKFSACCIPLKCIYTLSAVKDNPWPHAKDGISIDLLSPRQAFFELYNHTFKISCPGHSAELAKEFRHITRVATLTPLYRLTYPRDLALLPKLTETILGHDSD